MSFDSGFEKRQKVQISEVRRKRFPALGNRVTAEGPALHCAEAGRGDSEVDGGRGSEEVTVEEVKQMWGCEVVDGFKSV